MTAQPSNSLAPLQRVMLGDSLAAAEDAGHHVEQVEIRFAEGVDGGRVISAWAGTVSQTEVLRTAFLIEAGHPVGWESVMPGELLKVEEAVPSAWESWLAEDRRRPLLAPHQVPWRAIFWPGESRFVWTFHHALLDGRSITRILRGFMKRVKGGSSDSLEIPKWRPPSPAMISLGGEMLRRTFSGEEEGSASRPSPDLRPGDPAVRCLGRRFLLHLEALAESMEVTIATLLIWAWGQALAESSGKSSMVVEQVRAGAPQDGTAGFTMNLLPVRIRRGGPETLRELRDQLMALRQIESLSADAVSPGVFPEVTGPWCSVVMIERGTLHHLLGAPDFVESVALHERKGESLMATAHVLPDLRLEVEGPGRHGLLEAWIGILDREIHFS
ncbi:MAG: hypothetical protein V4584_08690 [Verrucomicrobiota bacterium]